MPTDILSKLTSRVDDAEKVKRSDLGAKSQASGSWRAPWFLTAVVSVVVIGAIGLFSMISNRVGVDDVMRDATASSGASPFTAIGSDLGMYGWVCALAIGIMSLLLAARHGGAGMSTTRYLVALLSLTLLLLLDDRLMLHEWAERYSAIYEIFVIGGLMLFAGLFFICGARWHHLGGWPLLLTSMSLFALSIGVDQVSSPDRLAQWIGQGGQSLHYLLEDGFKLAGIMFWLVFAARVAMRVVAQAEQSSPKGDRSVPAGALDDPAAV